MESEKYAMYKSATGLGPYIVLLGVVIWTTTKMERTASHQQMYKGHTFKNILVVAK